MPSPIDNFSGLVFAPGAPEYAAAALSHGTVLAPTLVARPQSASDIAAALRFARDNSLDVTVRSGGHSTFDMTASGLLLELGDIHSIDVLAGDRVRIGSGAVWGDVAAALRPHNLALSSGDTKSVGVGGLTLGGGVGWLVRQYGLALDSLLEAEVVLADGSIVTASASSERELFWAIRGGGGNFGVVSSFTFQAHPLAGIIGGSITLDPSRLAEALKAWRDVMRTAPRELNTTFFAMPPFGPEMPAVTHVVVCFASTDEAAAETAIAPLLDLPGVLTSEIGPKAYEDMLEDPPPAEAGMRFVDHNALAPDFSDEFIDGVAAAHESFGPAVLMIRYVRGAFNEVDVDATAFAHRNAEVLVISAGFLAPDAPDSEEARHRATWEALSSHFGGMYGNFSPTTADWVLARMYPPATAARLQAAKRAYDPDNVLRNNHNVMP